MITNAKIFSIFHTGALIKLSKSMTKSKLIKQLIVPAVRPRISLGKSHANAHPLLYFSVSVPLPNYKNTRRNIHQTYMETIKYDRTTVRILTFCANIEASSCSTEEFPLLLSSPFSTNGSVLMLAFALFASNSTSTSLEGRVGRAE